MSSEHVEVLRDLSEVCRAAIKAGDWKVDGACDPDAVLRRADSAIAALSAPQSGDWVLVPREASSEMLTAAIDAHLGFEGEDEVDAVWEAMISAAEQFGATAGHAVQDVGDGAEGGSRAPTRPTHFSGMFPRQDDPASSSLSHQAVDVGQFRPAVATHQLACRKRVRDCREGLLPTDNLPIYLEELAEANRLLDVVDRAAPQPPAEAGVVSEEDEVVCLECGQPTMHTGQVCYACSHPDTAPPSAPVGVEDGPIDASDNAEYIEYCADRLERCGLRVTAGALRVIAQEHRALAQQPAAGGEEIMVNAAHDVYTLPLQPSGLSSGPRFVVHVPGPEQPAAPVLAKHQPCGCVICTCEDEQQCQGCGAKHCGNRADHPPYVGQQPAAVDEAMERAAEEIERYEHTFISTVGASAIIRKHMRAAQQGGAK